jgi:hypothetical protein
LFSQLFNPALHLTRQMSAYTRIPLLAIPENFEPVIPATYFKVSPSHL